MSWEIVFVLTLYLAFIVTIVAVVVNLLLALDILFRFKITNKVKALFECEEEEE